ncbi:bacillithiol transferase BstA [soil metagenome]
MEQDLRYPIGRSNEQKFSNKNVNDEAAKRAHFLDIAMCPSLLENSILNLDEEQLDTQYRPAGWTIKQVIHHVADSHMNAYIRFKLGLTEENPTIKAYNEAAWAEIKDADAVPINVSLTLLHALHKKWYELLKVMTEEDFSRTVYHPEHKKTMTLWELLGNYAWHGKHHAAHITSLRERNRW